MASEPSPPDPPSPASPDAPIKVAVTLLGRAYTVACSPDGQERLREAAALVDRKLNAVAAANGTNSPVQLFLLASLLLADDVLDAQQNTVTLQGAQEDTFVTALERLTDRIRAL